MMQISRCVVLLMCLGLVEACDKSGASSDVSRDSLVLNERQARLDAALATQDTIDSDKPVALWKLPSQLNEISGLVLTSDGRLLTHGDEKAKVFEIDYRRGKVIKEFSVGSPTVHGDFESITMIHDSLALLTSQGVLYQFVEGADGASVAYNSRDTGLGEYCEFEGMVYDSLAQQLLMACKKVYQKALRDSLIIFRLSLALDKSGKGQPPTRLTVPLSKVIGNNKWERFEPSDITINPINGNYVLIASLQKAILEITPKGDVVFSKPLPAGHDQAEGVAITRDHLLIISDEAKGGPALITLYRWAQ